MRRTIVLGLLAACASKAPTPAAVPGHMKGTAEHPSYPTTRFVTGAGVSDESADDAAMKAKARVSEQIVSSIKSEASATDTESVKNGVRTSSTDARTKVKVTSDFGHAELIRVVEKKQDGPRFYAFAVLSREETQAALERDYAGAAAAFARACTTASASTTLGTFSAAYREARAAYPTLGKLAREIAAIAKTPHKAFGEDAARWNAVEVLRSQRLAAVSLTLSGGGDDLSNKVMAVATQALAKLGAKVANGACGGAIAASYSLQLLPIVTCKAGQMSVVCQLDASTELKECASGETVKGKLPASKLSAAADSEATARSRLLDGLNAESLSEALRPALDASLPIQ